MRPRSGHSNGGMLSPYLYISFVLFYPPLRFFISLPFVFLVSPPPAPPYPSFPSPPSARIQSVPSGSPTAANPHSSPLLSSISHPLSLSRHLTRSHSLAPSFFLSSLYSLSLYLSSLSLVCVYVNRRLSPLMRLLTLYLKVYFLFTASVFLHAIIIYLQVL